MTMRWPKPSMVCSRLRSSGAEDLGVDWKLLSSPHSNGSTGSITAASSSPSATCRLPRLKSATMLNCRRWLWRRNSNQPASGKPGAVHLVIAPALNAECQAAIMRFRTELISDDPAETRFQALTLEDLTTAIGDTGADMIAARLTERYLD